MTRYNPYRHHQFMTDGQFLKAEVERAKAERLAKARIRRALYASFAAFFALAVHLMFT